MAKIVLVAEAARILQLTPHAVRAMERRGELPAQRTGDGIRLFMRSEVVRVARERRRRRGEDLDAA